MGHLLTIDVGNTNITMALMHDEEVVGHFTLMTKTPRTSDEYGIFLKEFVESCDLPVSRVTSVMISSVVPKVMSELETAVIKYLKVEPFIVGPGIKTGIAIRADNPKEVGADRLVNVASAYYTYHRSCIIVDFGTATTFDYVSDKGVFEYTVIAPGIGISANALTKMTAKLPEVEIKKPESILGKNTVSGMQAGIVYGYIGLVKHILNVMKQELKDENCLVIATGGMGGRICQYVPEVDVYDENLAAKGMRIIYDKNH